MKGIAKTLLYTCKKATELIEKKQIAGLSLIERARLNGHLSLCDSCSVYSEYSRKINIILRSHLNIMAHSKNQIFTNELLKKRLLKLV